MKNEFMAILMLVLVLVSALNAPFITPQTFAEDIEGNSSNGDPLEKACLRDLSDESLNEEKKFIDKSENTLTKDSQNNEKFSFYEMPIYGGNNQGSNETFHWFNFTYMEGNKTRVVVGLNGDETTSLTKLEKIVADYHAKIVNNVSMGGIVRAVIVELSFASVDSFVKEVQSSGLASYIEPNVKIRVYFTPNDPYWSYQWGPRIIKADYAWDTTIGDSSVLVAIIDTGIDWNHPDLVANYVPLGYDWVNDDNDPMDDHGHGTHCAGIIAATINNSLGIAGLAQVRIMAEKAFDSEGWGTDDDIANAIVHAVDQGADILSNSWGSSYPSTLIYEAIQYAYNHGVLVIAAAGNWATSQKHYPAAYDEVIAVTATDSYDNPASFTNFGEWVELAAPGVDIYSTVWDDSYAYMSGTSMATPHVAGVAALILSRYPNMTRDQLRIQLRYTADDLGSSGFDYYYGYGRINAQNAVEQPPPDHDLLIFHWKKPKFVVPGTLAVVNTTVFNFGTSDEENITVQLLANGSLVDSETIAFLETGKLKTVNFTWTPTVEGIYNLTLYIVPVPNETITTNNLATAMVRVGYFKTILFDQTHATDSIFSYSVWIAFLNETGYIVDVHNSGPIEPAVLIGYDALVIPQAHEYYSSDELDAIESYVASGGGLFVIGDDAPDIYTQLTGFAGITWGWEGGCGGYTSDITPHPVTEGVETAYFATPFSNLYVSGQAQSLIRDYCGYEMLAASEVGAGKVVAIADEQSIDDGNIGYADNLQLAINIIEWITTRPEHDLAVLLDTPTYIEPGEPSLLNLTLHNRGTSNESNVKLFLLINDSIVDEVTIPELVGGSSHKLSYLWIPTVEAIYNVTGYVLPVQNETTIENNFAHAYVFVGYPVKAFVLHSAGNYYSNIIVNWETLNTKWYMFGDQLIYIDYTTLNIDDITYEDIAATEADVLIISCAANPYMGWEFTDAEIEAISRYVMEGHGLIATAGTFYYNVPNNNKLAPLFGLNESIMWSAAQTDLLYLLNTTHPLFDNVPNPLVFPQVGTATPYDGQWDLNELINGEYLALGYYQESAVVVRRGLVYISPMLEWIPPHYHHHLQLLYNAITWSRYQKPKHELTVSLEAPEYLEPSESVLLNATVYNGGLSNETNVELQLLINGSIATSTLIPELPTGESYTLSYLWTPTTEALYNITVYAPPVPNEDDETNNIVTKMVHVRSIIGLVVFEEAHLPAYSIGSNPAAFGTGGYSEFANFLMVNGYIVSTIDPGTIINSSVLASADVLVIVAPQNSYLESELDAIENWVKRGGNLLLISDWGPFGSVARTITSRFDIVLRGDVIGDFDENVGDFSQVYYDGANLLLHPATEGVGRVEIYAGDGILTAPAEEIPLIVTDYDRTAFWFSDNSPALGVSVMSAFEGGAVGYGRLIVMTDSNVWDSANDVDYDGDVGFYDSDNEVLAINSINWLSIRYEHDIAVILQAPVSLELGNSSLLNATVYNGGLSNETNVELQLLINGSIATSTLIPELPTGESYTLSYLWTPMRTGNYNITAYVLPVLGEECLENNIITKRTLVFYYQRLYLPHGWVGGGYSMGWHDDDASWQYTLPFDFPFYGIYYRDIYISSNGLITFIGPDPDFGNSIPDLATKLAIAPAWDDWVTNYPHDIYIWENSTHVGIRWDVQSFDAGVFANFEAILCVDGTIQFNYAFSDGVVSATIGISNGAGHIIAEDATSLNYMNTIIFTPLQPEHELVAQLEAPSFIEPENQVVLNATVLNQGLNNETNIELKLVINGSLVASKIIQELATGASDTLSYLWTPTVKGVYNVTVYVPPKPEEKYTLNNIVTRFVKVAPIRFVLFDQTHWTDAIWDYSLLIANLIERGFIVENHTTGPITPEVLEGFDALVIPQAHEYYSSDELDAIESYVSAGGGLFVIGDDAPDIYTQLTGFAGITWGWEGGCGGYTSDITPHPVTEGVETAYFDSPLSDLYVSGSAQDLIRDVYGNGLLAVSEIEAGKVVAIADEHSINDGYIGYADNLRLAVNIIEWITFHVTHDVAVLNVSADSRQVYVGQQVSINVTMANEGEVNETFTVEVYYQNATGANSTQTNLESRTSLVPMEPHDANAMWIEPSTVYLNWSYPVGYKFNVTVWANSSLETKGWQFWLVYAKQYINATRAGYTGPGGTKSEFFQDITTMPLAPSFKSHNDTHNRLDFGEAWIMGPYNQPGYGSLCWVEFEVINVPPAGVVVDIPLDIKWAYDQYDPPKTYLLYADGSYSPLDVYNGLVRFTEGAPPPPPSPPPPPTMPPGMIGQAEVSLRPGENITLTFTWNTTGVEFGNYTIKAIAVPVLGEQDTEDNTFIDGIVEVLWEHDVAILNVVSSRAWVYTGRIVNFTITAANKGDYIENVTVTLYYNFTAGKQIGTVQFENLAPNENRTLPMVWNTTGVEPSRNYTITAIAEIEKPDSNPADNTFSDAKVQIRILGDLNGDFYVGIDDINTATEAFGEDPTRPRWNPDADINGDNYIGIDDLVLIAQNFGRRY